MAIVKASFVKRGSQAKLKAKATLKYIQHRPGKEGSRIIRTLYGSDGIMERHEAHRMIDEAGREHIFFRFIISPDPALEDQDRELNMRLITHQTMQTLEERLQKPVLWVAADHSDHSDSRHVHVFALVPQRLDKTHFSELRQQATQASLEQRRELDQVRLIQQRQREEAEWGRGY